MRSAATLAFTFAIGITGAATSYAGTPSAATRTNASNFRDMVLAVCIARIEPGRSRLASDAASTARALVEWTYYDAEASPDKIDRLVTEYLKRDFRNPISDDDTSDRTEFGLLKCLDLYHSKELVALTASVVLHPKSARRK